MNGFDWYAILIWVISWFTFWSFSWNTPLTGTLGGTAGEFAFMNIYARVLNDYLFKFTSFNSWLAAE